MGALRLDTRQRRTPERTVLYRVLADHLETFLDRVAQNDFRTLVLSEKSNVSRPPRLRLLFGSADSPESGLLSLTTRSPVPAGTGVAPRIGRDA